jgi:hypothetical protein
MASRVCPNCQAKVPVTSLLLAGSGVACSRCQAELETDAVSKQVSVWVGLLAGFLAWRIVGHASGTFGWLLPVLIPLAVFTALTPVALAMVGGVQLASSS